jgi:hypothetical protein
MPYKDVDGVQYWVSERDEQMYMHRDPYKNAAETFARDVEVYLYREVNPDGSANPLYQNPDFLAWAIARYDACKTGSGHPWHEYNFSQLNPDHLGPVPPAGKKNYDGNIRSVEPPKDDD